MQVGALGPLEVRTGAGELVPVAGARLRALLILLALAPSRVVGTDRLVEALWGDQPPAGAGNALQTLVSRLRRAVPGIVVVPQPGGYQLDLEPDRVDLVRFERLAAAGRSRLRDDPADAAAMLREALALWRGPALADVARADFARATIVRLDELRLTAIQDRVDADLRLGSDAGLVAELDGLVAAHPLREPLVALFIRALDAAGRRAEALEVYERTRRRIVDQLGVQPSAELASLHVAMLRAEPDTARAVPRPQAEAGRPTAPRSQPAASPAVPRPQPEAGRTVPQSAAGRAMSRPEPEAGRAVRPAGPGSGAEPGAAVAAGEPARTNLRAERTDLIGREDDLAQVGKLLRAHRMTTLTGPGGAGKTRLASAAARGQLDAMPDGVWLVELAPVTDPAEVAPATLDALGLRQLARGAGSRMVAPVEESGDPVDRLVAALSDKHALLVLDNCEHLIDAAATLADRILSDCPRVTLLATSREPLSIGGEMLRPVQPLALPPESAQPALVTGYASVRLLAQRARAVRPGFEVNAGNALAVTRICRALDGMPLAIELAAARLNAMTPEQVASRLDDRFRLLTGGNRTALARHQTLAAVVGWSWDLLDDAERTLWRRLSVFAGGATLEAVERVCADDLVATDRVLDLLAALVDKSLLEMREDTGTPRYQMLEIIKAYGHDRLVEAGELDAAQRAHAGYFLELAENAEHHLLTAEQLAWLARLSADHDNLQAAVRGTVAAGDTRSAYRFVASLGLYWWLRGHKIEGAELSSAVLSLPGPAEEKPDAVPEESRVAAYTLGALLAVDSRYSAEAALGWFREAGRLAERIPDPGHPLIRLIGPLAHVFENSWEAGRPTSVAALDALVDDPFPWLGGTALMIRAHLALNYGHSHIDAEADIRAALERYRALGERWGISFATGTLGTFALWRGDFAEATACWRQAVAAIAELGGPEEEVQSLTQLARALWLRGDRDGAREQLARARRNAQRLGLPEPRGMAGHVTGDLARLDGDLPLARSELANAARFAGNRTVAPQLRAVIAAARTHLALADGDLPAARARYAEAVAAATSSVDAPVTGVVLVAGADLSLYGGDPVTAATLLGASAGVRGIRDLSIVDDERVAAAARDALGDTGFDEAYRAGLAATVDTWRELPGVAEG
ncbi:AfsR/SARP family transcriptional regulator [Rugosimonospora africana]|uniref:AfsR/SARP family transcriptional regulator n=1 Tax=Rugosimonospora africana TaxID=556532 RepID=UPI001940EA03|nr:BTAD domain-containing putative transcriptional regulator [Rugosimonospora africana]